jgi:hypothetical protein
VEYANLFNREFVCSGAELGRGGLHDGRGCPRVLDVRYIYLDKTGRTGLTALTLESFAFDKEIVLDKTRRKKRKKAKTDTIRKKILIEGMNQNRQRM